MKKAFRKSLFLFRRDLRLEDNTGLIAALKQSETVIPAFILTPEQIDQNPYRSDHCLRFMIESLQDLDTQLKKKGSRLYLFQGKPDEIIGKCCHALSIDALFVNRDYTPYSRHRDEKLERICKREKIPFYSFDDALLHPPESTLKETGKPYLLFTPYFRNASKRKVAPPVSNKLNNYFSGNIPFAKGRDYLSALLPSKIENRFPGGRAEALKILKQLSHLKNYARVKDFPAEDYSTHLSAYLKFTVCSPREIYREINQKLGPHHPLIRSLYWRDFFTSVAFFFPHIFKGAFSPKWDHLPWSSDKKAFQRWCVGKTGFPIVDAGMREMNETGFMHNRVRMITASFLIKDLHIDWRLGEKYFAQTLIDYDPAVNNGNWQWVASTGCDAQPYFRVFNPWTQQKKFDPQCLYIKKWIPELRTLAPKTIHGWDEEKYHTECPAYPPPMVSHTKAAEQAIRTYRSLKKK